MKATGHQTLSIFRPYNPVALDEFKALVGEKIHLNTHVDIHHSKANPANSERL